MSNRKLQAEIDKVLKQVAVGVEAFEGVYVKLMAAANPTQKEKLEGDLKKEIKKLQRFRDQIKTWIGSSEIKDKDALLENRRLIETQMEKFKACEKELKTKAFSKEGLLATQKLDPLEQERSELTDKLREIIETLETQIDAFEFETEKLRTGKKKNSANTDKIAKLDKHIERHKHHIKMIEIVLRLHENGDTEMDLVKNLIEDVTYYADSNQEPDFEEDEGIYDDLNLDDAEAYGINPDDDNSSESEEETPSAPEPKPVEELKKEEKAPPSPAKQTIKVVPAKNPPKEEAKAKTKTALTPARTGSSAEIPTAITPAIPQSAIRYAAAAAAVVASPSAAVVEKKSAEVINVPTASVSPTPPRGQSPARANQQQFNLNQWASASPSEAAQNVPAQQQQQPQPPQQQQQQQQHHHVPAAVSIALAATRTPVGQIKKEVLLPKEELATPQEPLDNRLPPALKDMVTSFVITKERSTTKSRDESMLFNHMLETSFRFIPEPMDFERQKHYVPQTSYPTPSYYPQHPLAVFDNPAVFEKFDIDTLFFIFYHQQGTYQQLSVLFLAAQELKKQSWRFHKKYQTWFQRFEEPKAITDEYEQGTYVYFDYEGSWCQRKKMDFRFDYKWLEDESV
ncbi:general negative regulator of transcription subunit 5 [Podochytrium sp. JEL0797]|nr:general negative regulator of transcription subunit 5 [Podochytrium sp. JEL0797]